MKKLLNNLTISIKETIINQETFLIFLDKILRWIQN